MIQNTIRALLKKRIVQNLLILFFSFLLIISLIELYFKLFSPQILSYTSKGLLISDKDSEFRLSPNYSGLQSQKEYVVHIETNSLGFRNKEIQIEKPKDTYRIIALGDSFTMGFGVEGNQTWAYLLEELMNKYPPQTGNTPVKFETINCGVGGYGTKQEIAFYKNYCSKLNPDMIILGFFIGNDVYDNADIEPLTAIDGLLINKSSLDNYLKEKNKIFSLKNFINNFHTTYFIRNRISGLKEKKVIMPVVKWYKNPFYHQLGLVIKNTPQEINKEIEATFKIIEEFDVLLKNEGVKLVVLLIPFREQVINERREVIINKTLTQTYKCEPSDFDISLPQKRFTDFLSQKSVLVCDVLPNLIKSPDNSKTYYIYDVHLTEIGHKIMAENLHRFLLRNQDIFVNKNN